MQLHNLYAVKMINEINNKICQLVKLQIINFKQLNKTLFDTAILKSHKKFIIKIKLTF